MNSESYPELKLPPCILWTAAEVATWIENLGFPHYKECFETNFITGRKLVLLEASHFPKMGITSFEDIKFITSAIRKLLNTLQIQYFRNLSLPPKEPWALYLEEHSRTGTQSEKLTYPEFLKKRRLKHKDL